MEDSPFEFARPHWLYAGMGLCVVIVLLFIYFDRRREAALALLVHPRFRQRLVPGHSTLLRRVKRVLWILSVLLLSVAAAGPRKGYEWKEVKRRGIDILFAVDTSRSMLAEDLTPNRLERARMGIHDFLGRLEGDRVGLIPFAGSSLALCPLTTDYDAFRDTLDALDTDIIPRQGTDVASAIREAERLFSEQGNNFRVLVLITDGEDLQGDALEEAESSAKKGTKIYPIGVGGTEGALIPIRQPNGATDFVRDDTGNPVRTKLDEAMLKKIADATGGLYAPLGRGAEGLDTIYREKLRMVPKNETGQRIEKQPLERFEWPLGAAILLLIMEFLLPDRRRETKVRALPSAARRHPAASSTLVAAVAGVLLVSASPLVATESKDPRVLYNDGTEEFNAGHFDKAAELLRSSLNTPDLSLQNRSYYNLGNSLYRIGQAQMKESKDQTMKSWEEAIKAFEGAIALQADDAAARHNRDLVSRKLEELKKQSDQQNGGGGDENKDEKDKKEKEDQKDQKQNSSKDGKKDSQKDKPQDGSKDDKKSDQGGDKKENSDKKDGQGDEKKPEDKNTPGTGADQKKEENKQGGKDQKDAKPMQEGKEGDKKDAPQPGDGEKKEDKKGQAPDPKSAEEKDGKKDKAAQEMQEGSDKKDKDDKSGEPSGVSEERRKPGEMTPDEARMLLQTLRSDEKTVIPVERIPNQRRFRDPNNTTRGKTW
jgi:Ca-activated chloride channel family protein